MNDILDCAFGISQILLFVFRFDVSYRRKRVSKYR